MAICTFDNPVTMARECYADKRLLCKYASRLFFLHEWPVPAEYFFFGANIGDWKEGQFWGDKEALPEKYHEYIMEVL